MSCYSPLHQSHKNESEIKHRLSRKLSNDENGFKLIKDDEIYPYTVEGKFGELYRQPMTVETYVLPALLKIKINLAGIEKNEIYTTFDSTSLEVNIRPIFDNNLINYFDTKNYIHDTKNTIPRDVATMRWRLPPNSKVSNVELKNGLLIIEILSNFSDKENDEQKIWVLS